MNNVKRKRLFDNTRRILTMLRDGYSLGDASIWCKPSKLTAKRVGLWLGEGVRDLFPQVKHFSELSADQLVTLYQHTWERYDRYLPNG